MPPVFRSTTSIAGLGRRAAKSVPIGDPMCRLVPMGHPIPSGTDDSIKCAGRRPRAWRYPSDTFQSARRHRIRYPGDVLRALGEADCEASTTQQRARTSKSRSAAPCVKEIHRRVPELRRSTTRTEDRATRQVYDVRHVSRFALAGFRSEFIVIRSPGPRLQSVIT